MFMAMVGDSVAVGTGILTCFGKDISPSIVGTLN